MVRLKIIFIAFIISFFAGKGIAQTMTIESLEGPVLASEINSFKAYLKSVHPAPNNLGNNWVYGNSGAAMEAIGMMYEITNDLEILNHMIRFADAALQARNSEDTGRIIWTGKRELCWPNKPINATDVAYSGSENGDVLAHIAYCAKLIIQQKELWNKQVTIGDPYKFGNTYIKRAKKYIEESDKTIDSFILPHFVKKHSYKFHWPQNDQWNALGPRYQKDGGRGIPWNQQVMLAGGFQRLAECHELLQQQPQRVALYDTIVKTYADWFISQLVSYPVNGHDCYKWSYAVDDFQLRYMEDQGHAGYDVWGICRAYERSKYKIPEVVMQKLANTVQYVLYKGNGQFAKRVDGSNGVNNHLGASFLNLAKYKQSLYPIIASANLEMSKSRLNYFAHIVFIKNSLYKNTAKRQ